MTEKVIIQTDAQYLISLEEFIDEVMQHYPILSPGEIVLLVKLKEAKKELEKKVRFPEYKG